MSINEFIVTEPKRVGLSADVLGQPQRGYQLPDGPKSMSCMENKHVCSAAIISGMAENGLPNNWTECTCHCHMSSKIQMLEWARSPEGIEYLGGDLIV